VKTLPEQREGRSRERDGEEGYRGTVVVCGKSVHIIRCNRKEEISVGTRGRGGGRMGVSERVVGEGGIICMMASARGDPRGRREDRVTQRQI